jgi:3-hydroxy-9,10-secoandrosta-1,3,5(10)-triene-9,17-dione monooxygenase reductase component
MPEAVTRMSSQLLASSAGHQADVEDTVELRAIDKARFRSTMAHVPSPVAVVTALGPAAPVGLAVGSFVSVSLEPTLIGFFVAETSTSWPSVRRAGSFCVNILAEDQANASRAFAKSGAEKFSGLAWTPSPSGAPILANCAVWIDCNLESETVTGDHSFVLGRVNALHVEPDMHALIFHRGGYTGTSGASLTDTVEPGNNPLDDARL